MVKQSSLPCKGQITALKFCEQIFVSYVVPFFQTHDAEIYQQDNAHVHSANYTGQVLVKNHIATVNGHLDLSIYGLLNMCGTFLQGAISPKFTSTTFGNLRLHCRRNGPTFFRR